MRINPKSSKDNIVGFGKQKIKDKWLSEHHVLLKENFKKENEDKSHIIMTCNIIKRNDLGNPSKPKLLQNEYGSLQITSKRLHWGRENKPYYKESGKRIYIDHINLPKFYKMYKKMKR